MCFLEFYGFLSKLGYLILKRLRKYFLYFFLKCIRYLSNLERFFIFIVFLEVKIFCFGCVFENRSLFWSKNFYFLSYGL